MTSFSIEPVARHLLGDPNQALSTKTELRWGRKGALAVDLEKDTYFDHEEGEGGGVLDLVCRERGGTRRDAHDWIRDELRLVDADESSRQPHVGTDASRKCRFALKTLAATRDGAGTHAETYLRGRGFAGPIPPSLRFHPKLKHTDSGLFFPTMVAGVQEPDGKVIAVLRTFLLPDGRGKARVNRPKMALGRLEDGAIRLAPAEKALGLAEGIETALSAMQLFEIPVWVALSCGRFASVAIPDDVVELQIFADNGAKGLEAADRAARHFASLGKRVFVRRPHPRFGDWNDALRKIGP
jgi:hypothetical protein